MSIIKTITSFINQRIIMRDATKATRKVRALMVKCSKEHNDVVIDYVVEGGVVDNFVGRKNTNPHSLVWGITPWAAVDIQQGREVAQSDVIVAISPGFSV